MVDKENRRKVSIPENMTNTLNLTPEMIDLIDKAGVSIHKSLNNANYQINILYQLQYDMNLNPENYSIRDAKVLNKMKMQIKDNPIFTRIDDPKFQEMSLDHRSTWYRFNTLDLFLSSINLDSEQSCDKYKQFYKERILSGFYMLYLYFDGLPLNLYHKAFQLIDELFWDLDQVLKVLFL